MKNILNGTSVLVSIATLALSAGVHAAPKASAPKSAPRVSEAPQGQEEDWKGPLNPADYSFGLQAGLGLLDPKAGVGLAANAGFKLVEQGFAPDISNQVFMEVQAGPLFVAGHTAFVFSTHLRWDFRLNPDWTLFALGGLGGNVTGRELGDRFMVYPRFGVGGFKRFDSMLALRIEVSHEFTSLGLSFWF